MAELYKKWRPKSFNDVVGQDKAITTLKSLRGDKFPHTLLFTGGAGTGKTTICRILRTKLECADLDFMEVNAADDRGIDIIRDIRKRMNLAPINGKCRVWLIDECHQLTAQAQESFLKILEDTPKHVYFFLASTDPQKLKKTIISRSTEIKLQQIPGDVLDALVERIGKEEGAPVNGDVKAKIVELAEGSARKALVFLNQVIGIDGDDKQLEVLEAADVRKQAVEIARALLAKGTTWKKMAEILSAVDEEAESIRWLVLGYMTAVALKGNPTKACRIIDEFRDNFYDSKKAGLVASCYQVISGGE